MKELIPQIAMALGPIFVAILGWVSAKVVSLITAKTKNEYLKGVLTRLDLSVYAAVREVSQTYVDDLKNASADGTLTDEEKAEAKRKAIEKAKSYLGVNGLNELMKVFGMTSVGEAESLLSCRIEAQVAEVRAATPR